MTDKRYGTLADGVLTLAPRVLRGEHGESIITGGDDAAMYFEHGYKAVVYTPQPTEAGFVFTPSWEQNETSITRVWTSTPEPENETADMQAALEILGVTAEEAT